MIYLIGGAGRCGKSTLSRKLSKKLNIPYFSLDNLRPVIIPYYKGIHKHKNFPFEKMFSVDKINDYFNKFSGKQMLQADLTEAKAMWPGIKNLIDHLLTCKTDYVLEAVYLLPKYVKEYKGHKNIRILYLTRLDEEKTYKGILKNKGNSDWLLDNTENTEAIKKAAQAMCIYGEYFTREAKKYKLKYINTENNFQRQLNRAVHFFTN